MVENTMRISQFRQRWPGPQPVTARGLDAESRLIIEHVRIHGRLPGAGALECWETFGGLEFEPSARHTAAQPRVELTIAAITVAADELERINQRNRQATAEAIAAWHNKLAKREAGEIARRAELDRADRQWRHELKRFATNADARRKRWISENEEWTLWERRREVKQMRRDHFQIEALDRERRTKERAAHALEAQRAKRAMLEEEQRIANDAEEHARRAYKHEQLEAKKREARANAERYMRPEIDPPISKYLEGFSNPQNMPLHMRKDLIATLVNTPNTIWSPAYVRKAFALSPEVFTWVLQQLISEGRIKRVPHPDDV